MSASQKPHESVAPPSRPTRLGAASKLVYNAAYLAIMVLFAICALALIAYGALETWRGVNPLLDVPLRERFAAIVEGIGLLTIAVASLELSQTVLEEEVQREALMSAPTRARRFLSRFMLVVIVSLSVELLVFVIELIHDDPERLPHAAALGGATALLLIGWGVFVRLNESVERLEPEAMEAAKREDQHVQ